MANQFADLIPKKDENLLDTAVRMGSELIGGKKEELPAQSKPAPSNDNKPSGESTNQFADLIPKKPEDLLGAAARVGRAGVKGVADWVAAVPEGAELRLNKFQEAVGYKGEEEVGNTAGFKWGERLRRNVDAILGGEEDTSLEATVAGGLGSMAPQIGAQYAGGVLGGIIGGAVGGVGGAGIGAVPGAAVGATVGATATGAVLGSTVGASQMYREAKEAGADEETALAAAELGSTIGLTEVIPLGRALKWLPAKMRGEIGNAFFKKLVHIAKSQGEEAAQEMANQTLQNLAAQGTLWDKAGYDPTRKTDQGVIQAGIAGAFGGTVSGTIGVVTGEADTVEPAVDPVGSKGVGADEKAALAAATGPATTPPAVGPSPAEEAAGAATGSSTAGVDPDIRTAVETPADRAKRVSKARELLRTARGPVTSTELPAEEAAAAAPAAPAAPAAAPAGAYTLNAPGHFAYGQQVTLAERQPEDPNLRRVTIASSGQTITVDATALTPAEAAPAPEAPVATAVPGAETALAEGIPQPPPGTPLPTEQVPAQPEVATQEAVQPGSSADEGMATDEVPEADKQQTVPETPETISKQVELLLQGKKQAVLYPEGSTILPKPDNANIIRFYAPGMGLIDYDKRQVSGDVVRWLIKNGKSNELLGLGPISKAQAAASEAAGSPAVAVVKRDAEGTPLVTAAGTEETAPAQVAALEAEAEEGETVGVEPVDGALAERQIDAEAPSSLATGQEPSQATTLPATSETALGGPPVAPETTIEEAGLPPPVEPAPGPRIIEGSTPEEIAAINVQTEAQLAANLASMNQPNAFDIEQAQAETEQQVEQKAATTRGAEESAVRASLFKTKLSSIRQAAKDRQAAIADETFEQHAPIDQDPVSNSQEASAYIAELQEAVTFANEQFEAARAELTAANRGKLDDKAAGYLTMPKQGAKVGYKTNTGHIVWLAEAARLARKAGRRLNKKDYADLNAFIVETRALKQGDSDLLRERRKVEGAQEKKVGPTTAERAAAGTEADTGKKKASVAKADELPQGTVALRGLGSEERKGSAVRSVKLSPEEEAAILARTAPKPEPELPAQSKAEAAKVVSRAKEAPAPARKELTEEEKAQRLAQREAFLERQRLAAEKAAAEKERLQAIQRQKDEARQAQQASAQLQEEVEAEEQRAAAEEAEANVRIEREAMEAEAERPRSKEQSLREAFGLPPTREMLIGKEMPLGEELGGTFDAIVGDRSAVVNADTAHNVIDDYLNELEFSQGNSLVDGFITPLMQHFREILPASTRVVVIKDSTANNIMGFGTWGQYFADGDVILLRQRINRDPVQGPATLAHELVHATVQHALEADPELRAKLADVMIHVRQQLPRQLLSRYGMTDVHEFLAEAVGNKKFRGELANVRIPREQYQKWGLPVPSNPKYQTVLNWLKKFISDILGIDTSTPTALDAAMETLGHLLDMSSAARTKFYAGYSDQPGNIFASGYINSPSNPPNFNVHYGPDEKFDSRSLKKEVDEEEEATALTDRLQAAGIPEQWADDLAELIDVEFGGDISDAELTKLAAEFSKPIVDLKTDIPKRVEAAPPKMKAEVAKLGDKDPSAPSRKMSSFGMVSMPLNVLADKYGVLFTDSKGVNHLQRWLEVQQRRDVLAEKHRLPHEENARLLRRYQKKNGEKTLELADIALEATQYDLSLVPGATNDHLGIDKKKYIQAKKALPELQRRFNALPKEARNLYIKVTKSYRDSHNAANFVVVNNLIDHMKLGLDPVTRKLLIDKTINGTLVRDDTTTFGISDEVFDALRERSLHKINGDYFPLMRFGNHVVTTYEDIEVPALKSVTTKSGVTVPVKATVDGKNVRFTMDNSVRGSSGALEAAVDAYVANHKMRHVRTSERWTERGTNKVVKKGEQEIGKDYDLTVEVEFQNQGVNYFEKVSDAKQFIKDNKDKHAGPEVLKRQEDLYASSMLEGSNLAALQRRIDSNPELSDFEKGRMRQALAETLASAQSGNRTPSNYLKRRGVLGASDDLGRAATVYGYSHGNMMANLELGPELREAMTAMNQLSQIRTTNQSTRQDVVAELGKRGKLIDQRDPPNELVQAMATLSSLKSLFSPAYWMTNGAQPYMNTLPELAGEHGLPQATAAMASAAARMGIPTTIGKGMFNTAKATALVGAQDIDMGNPVQSAKKKLGSKYHFLLDAMVDRGAVSENAGYEVGKVSMARPGKIRTVLSAIDRISRQMPAAVEVVNRIQSAVAAYDLAIKKGMTQEEATNYAITKTTNTQFDYRPFNQARLMMGSKTGWAFQFKQYGINQAWAYVKGFQTVLGKSATKEQRLIAAGQLAARFGLQTLLVGVTSNLGSELLKIFGYALDQFTPEDDDHWAEWKTGINGAIIDAGKAIAGDTGQWWGELIASGAINKVTGLDVSTKMGMEDMFFNFLPNEVDGKSMGDYLWSLYGGAPGGIFTDLAQAKKKFDEGKVDEALSLAIPIKFWADYYKGKAKFEKGEGYDERQWFWQTMGFRTDKETKDVAKGQEEYKSDPVRQYRTKRDDLVEAYKSARTPSERARVTSQIREFNRKKKPDQVWDISITNENKKVDWSRKHPGEKYKAPVKWE